jgi:hypothetical protein
MTVTALCKNPDPPGGPLREAQAVASAARQKVAATEVAVERAANLVAENRRKLEAAHRAIEAARAEDVEQLATAIAKGGTVSPQAANEPKRRKLKPAKFLRWPVLRTSNLKMI